MQFPKQKRKDKKSFYLNNLLSNHYDEENDILIFALLIKDAILSSK